jgi:hypothetical protein
MRREADPGGSFDLSCRPSPEYISAMVVRAVGVVTGGNKHKRKRSLRPRVRPPGPSRRRRFECRRFEESALREIRVADDDSP